MIKIVKACKVTAGPCSEETLHRSEQEDHLLLALS